MNEFMTINKRNHHSSSWTWLLTALLVLVFCRAGSVPVGATPPSPSPGAVPAASSPLPASAPAAPSPLPVPAAVEPSTAPAPAAPTMVPSPSPLPASIDLDLKAALELASQYNLYLQRSRSLVETAKAQLDEARSAKHARFDISGNYREVEPSASFNIGPQRVTVTPENSWQAALAYQQLLCSFGKIENAIAAAALRVKAVTEDYSRDQEIIAFQVKKGYFDVLRAQDLVQVAEDAEDIATGHYNTSLAMYDAGTVPRYDVIRSEVGRAEAHQRTIMARNGLQMARASFINLLGIDQDTPYNLKPVPQAQAVSVDLAAVQALGRANRSEVQAMLYTLDMSRYLVASAASGQAPNLILNSQYQLQTATALSQSGTWASALAVQWPIFDGGYTRARVKQARESLHQVEIAYQDLLRAVDLEVKQAYLKLLEAQAMLETTNRDVDRAEEGLAIARIRYQEGMSTSLELDDAQAARTVAQVTNIGAIYEYFIALSGLERATGSSLARILEVSGSAVQAGRTQ